MRHIILLGRSLSLAAVLRHVRWNNKHKLISSRAEKGSNFSIKTLALCRVASMLYGYDLILGKLLLASRTRWRFWLLSDNFRRFASFDRLATEAWRRSFSCDTSNFILRRFRWSAREQESIFLCLDVWMNQAVHCWFSISEAQYHLWSLFLALIHRCRAASRRTLSEQRLKRSEAVVLGTMQRRVELCL